MAKKYYIVVDSDGVICADDEVSETFDSLGDAEKLAKKEAEQNEFQDYRVCLVVSSFTRGVPPVKKTVYK